MPDARSSLIYRVGTTHCALPLEHVAETMRPLPLDELSGLPQAAGGTATVRGAKVPVIIVNRWFTRGETQPERLIIARAGERHLGLAVDEVTGVRDLDGDVVDRLPPLLDEAPEDVIAALDPDLIAVLRAARIVPAQFLDAAERKAGS